MASLGFGSGSVSGWDFVLACLIGRCHGLIGASHGFNGGGGASIMPEDWPRGCGGDGIVCIDDGDCGFEEGLREKAFD